MVLERFNLTIRCNRLRIATYNVHKCRGLDLRVQPQRIAEVLHEIDADVIAMQEVLGRAGGEPQLDQAGYIAAQLGFSAFLGENRRLNGRAYGNLILSRFPLRAAYNYDISRKGRERRGCARVDVEVAPGMVLHVFNVHLGTAYRERRQQGRMLLTPEILNDDGLRGARVVLGDFNEWTSGLTTRLLRRHFRSVEVKKHVGRSRTYPGVVPFLHLDHIYFDPLLTLQNLKVHRTRTTLIASDHLPLVADFDLSAVS
jgi:endonuclease/exonuclease/phosphatase family metal-dependent hydrolase